MPSESVGVEHLCQIVKLHPLQKAALGPDFAEPISLKPLDGFIQSTPVISRQLEAKIREHQLSGSPFISRYRTKAQTRDLQARSQSHTMTSASLKPQKYVER